MKRPSTFQGLALTTAASTYALLVLGGVVRATGSGLACPDWPMCHGQLIPPLEGPILIEYAHRLDALWVSLLIVASAFVAWRYHRSDRSILYPAVLGVPLLIAQIMLGGLTVLLELPPGIVLLHLATALGLLASTVITATIAFASSAPMQASGSQAADRSAALAWMTTLATFALLLSGGYVVRSGASLACPDWPLCLGQFLPAPRGPGIDIQLTHRFAAAAVGVLLALLALHAWRTRQHPPRLALLALLSLSLYGVQVLVGASVVVWQLPVALRALHLALGSALWAALVAIAALSYPRAALTSEDSREHGEARPDSAPRSILLDYLSLTKPRIILLLLITTLAAMLLAQAGWPPPSLILATLLGGALAAGGASALNCYLDRDLDALMARTRLRPLPARRIAPARALAFGLALSFASVVELAVWVNAISAVLATAGIVYYVLLYTAWLKRSSHQNIVIGGAAGAVPPLVGWAAVTGRVELLPVLLFVIVFMWTPPHFWALALLRRQDYAKARVPMLPVVRGERETRRHIMIYALSLAGITLVLAPLGLLSLIYLGSAILLNAYFIQLAWRVWRDASPAASWRLYKYSIAYLALLFVAMVADRALIG